MRVDLEAETITAGNSVFSFTIRADWKKRLINGWDDVDLTKSYTKQIEAFILADAGQRPWAAPQR